MVSFAQGRQWLSGVVGRQEGANVVYRRRAQPQNPITVLATQGNSTYESEEAGPVMREFRTKDFLIDADLLDLDNGAGRFEPEEGDRIEITMNGATHIYEAMRPISTEPCFRYSNAGETRVRIHTKRVKS